jgi:signal transduction histidine kinase
MQTHKEPSRSIPDDACTDTTIVENRVSSSAEQTAWHSRKLRILLVEDSEADSDLMVHALQRGGLDSEPDVIQTAGQFREKIRNDRYEIVLADYRLPGWNGMETVEILRREGLDIPVVLVSGALGEQNAVECIKQGAADYVLKDHLTRLPTSVRRVIEEKRLRDENRRTQEELARSNRDLEQFAYVASHDLQEPLRMVAMYTQLLAQRYQGKLDASADKYIHYAVDGALRMQALVQDLLAFSRVGRMGTDLQEIETLGVVEIALKNLQSAIQESAAKISRGDLPVIFADRTQMIQLFQNLIGNALKFRGSDSPQIQITAEREEGKWCFSVQDNGIGIAAKHLDEVFGIFRRLHTRAEYPGNGIGLAICKKIVEQHGGTIWVDSQPKKGSDFRFTIPVRKGIAQP